MVVSLGILIVIWVLLHRYPKLRQQIFASSASGRVDTRILIAIGVVLFNLVTWRTIPWFWNIYAHTWDQLLVFNIGLWFILYLPIVKEEDATGKAIPHTRSLILAKIVTIALIAGLVTTTSNIWDQGDLTDEEYKTELKQRKTKAKVSKVLAEAQKVIEKEPVLVAVSKCVSEDFDTKEKAQSSLAKYKESGIMTWKLNKLCIDPLLPRGTAFKLAVVEAVQGKWSEKVFFPAVAGYQASADCSPGEDYKVRYNGDDTLIFRKSDTPPLKKVVAGKEEPIYYYGAEFKGVGGPARVIVTAHPTH